MSTQSQESDYSSLIKEIKDNIRTRLGDLMSKLLNQANENLFEMAESASSNEESTRYFELMRELKAIKQEIAVDYLENTRTYLRPYPVIEAEKLKQSMDLEDELSLVEKSEVDDMVIIKSLGERAASKYREQLSHLEARLEHLALKTDNIFPRDALSPVNFCQAFDNALGDNFDVESKKLLFSFFNIEVIGKLESLYDSINNRLIDAGILPQIKLHQHQKPKRRRSDAPGQDMPMEEMPEDGEPQTYGNYAMTATPGASFGGYRGGSRPGMAGAPGGMPGAPGGMPGGMPGAPGGMPGAPGGMPGAPGGMPGAPGGMPGAPGGMPGAPGGMPGAPGGMPGAPGGMPGAPGGMPGEPGGMPGAPGGMPGAPGGMPGAPGVPGETTPGSGQATPGGGAAGTGGDTAGTEAFIPGSGGYSHYTAGMPANQVSQILGQFFGVPIARSDAPDDSEAAQTFAQYTASTPQYYGHDEILNALNQVQASPQFLQPEEAEFDAEAIKQSLLDEIAKKSGGAVTKRINQIAEKTIDFIELIFDAIIDDEEISDTIKALLLRLQIPVIKASMVDQEFFIYDDHPARVLLDKIADVGVGVTDHNDDVYIRLDRIVTNLVSDYELQTSSFQEALDKVNAFVEELEAEARQIEEEAQRQVLREHARNVVLKSLRSVTAGKILPEAVHPLVLKRWPTLMFNHYLEHGKENDDWILIIEILRDIILSVQPIESAEELAHLQATQGEMISRVREHLGRTNQSQKDIDTVVQGLVDTQHNLINACDFSDQQMEQAEEHIADEDWRPKAEVAREPEPVEPKPQLPSSIMPGMWFRIHMGEDTAARRCKLSVVIVEDSRLVFVNHAGEIVVEKSFDEFKQEVDNGLSSVIMGHSVFDHALNSVITRLAPEENR